MNKIRVCVAGATGWAASELCKAIVLTNDIEIVAAVSRQNANRDLRDVLGIQSPNAIPVSETVEEALRTPCDVFMEYTHPDVAKHNILTGLHANANVVVGTSGLSDADYDEIEKLAVKQNRAVLAVGNFALSVVLLTKFAEMAAKYMLHWEIIDYASAKKVDSPSGSALQLANRLAKVGAPHITVPIENTKGIKETRGATINKMQVHSVRLPGYVISLEAIFGMESEKLILRHEAGSSAVPYVQGALMAIRRVGSFTGLKRGLDQVMEF